MSSHSSLVAGTERRIIDRTPTIPMARRPIIQTAPTSQSPISMAAGVPIRAMAVAKNPGAGDASVVRSAAWTSSVEDAAVATCFVTVGTTSSFFGPSAALSSAVGCVAAAPNASRAVPSTGSSSRHGIHDAAGSSSSAATDRLHTR